MLGKYFLHLIAILQSVFGGIHANISNILFQCYVRASLVICNTFFYYIISFFREKKVLRLFIILIFRKYDMALCLNEIVFDQIETLFLVLSKYYFVLMNSNKSCLMIDGV